ncbi:2-oxoglutarate and Fe(II)-dependent oxygenase superfamily protein [Quillaja saponaria]|uniref:2-oxoglutarate and Fe(II)-dependent oxygenase superfamily protein n=1 Tax=Quillaja saponaria TaxID=32244 RepID=A0AAD7LWE1_QUISA|nr:2-oxoglutarate and Fe(II)-dependent oxygenase superfamily protein [Quillaja saponaria]
MAETAPLLNKNLFEPNSFTFLDQPNDSFLINHHQAATADNTFAASDDEVIPTIDYCMLFSDDQDQQFKALKYLGQVCEEYGFFYLVNHNISYHVFEDIFKGISDFFDPTTLEERVVYEKKSHTDRMRWGLRSSSGENREYLKVIAHPHPHFPSKPSNFSEILEEYFKEMREIELGLARAVSKTLGFEECYIEKALNLKSGFDVSSMNLYPPNYKSKGRIGVPEHTDPGFCVTLVQDVNGGLQVLSHQGKWINVYLPRNAILVQLGDHLEILTNGKYKSHIHRVIVDNNQMKRISVATLHGPSLDTFVSPAPEFVDEEDHPPAYLAMTYKESLEANGGDEIDVQSSMEKIRL